MKVGTCFIGLWESGGRRQEAGGRKQTGGRRQEAGGRRLDWNINNSHY